MKTEVIKLYQDREDVTLTSYILEDSPELLKGKPRPAVLICPGGAYLTCSDREGEPVALRFAAMGYHAFVLRYSVYMEGGGSFPDMSRELKPNEKCIYPAPVRDIGKAFLTIRSRAKEWLVDMDKVALCGFSAGAHNSAMYSTYWHTPLLSEYFNEAPEAFRPAATILGYTLSDYIFMKQQNETKTQWDKMLFEASLLAYLGTTQPTEQQLEEVSPALHVTENTPPMFLWSTAADSLVPVQHTIRMAHALADQKIPFEIHIFEEGPHGLSLATQASAEAKSQIYPDVAKWASLADAWLQKRFTLLLPEKTPWEDMVIQEQR